MEDFIHKTQKYAFTYSFSNPLIITNRFGKRHLEKTRLCQQCATFIAKNSGGARISHSGTNQPCWSGNSQGGYVSNFFLKESEPLGGAPAAPLGSANAKVSRNAG